MAESGVTEESLKTKITEQLQATHVAIEDMSGIAPLPLHAHLFLDICSHSHVYIQWKLISLQADVVKHSQPS